MKHVQRPASAAPLAVLILAALASFAPAPASAQTVPPPGTSAQDIQRQVESMGVGDQLRQRLLNSGMSPAQMRQQLASRGYDPSILDAYLGTGVDSPPAPTRDVLTALQALDIQFQPDTTRLGAVDSARLAPGSQVILPDSTAIEREHDLRVFGLRTFARGTSEFEPMAIGPVPPGYMLGPGDELTLILTGDVEQAYTLPVTREGFVVIPQVGQVWVNGLTLSELRDRLFGVLGQAYSGIGRGPEASTHFEITLGRLRSNQLFITGEVVQPGSYLTSPVASVLNALYQAHGPQPNGSFRSVRVMRDGGLAAEVDLYGYLTRGDNLSGLALQPGDVIFVPIHGPQVAVKGEVGRPAIYEVLPGEDLMDLLQFAGGLTAPAALGRARITRILPAGERTEAGVDRTVVEVDLSAMIRGLVPAPKIRDGDELRVFRVRPELRRVITVSGAVWKDCEIEPRKPQGEPGTTDRGVRTGFPGDTVGADSAFMPAAEDTAPVCTFAFRPGMRAWDAIAAAEGLKPDALRARAHIARLDPSDSTVSVVDFSLETGPDGLPIENPVLQEHDAIRIFSRTTFQDSMYVRVSGEVREGPRRAIRFREGLTLGDLLLEAGGLTPAADLEVEVTRRPDPAARDAGQLTETFRVPVDRSYIVSDRGIRYYRGDTAGDDGVDRAEQVVLQPDDHIFVRRLPNLEDEDRTVALSGEVQYPGSYMLTSKGERLSQVIERAGGLSMTAFPGGFRFYRDGTLASVDLERVLEAPGSRYDIVLLPGDSMVVPEYNPVVTVRGAVNSPAAVMYREGAGLDYYIQNAGGYARHADRDAVHIRYANGLGAVSKKVLLFKTAPEPGPGSTVTVPLVPEDARTDVGQIIRDVAQVAATIGTALLVFTRF